jgi:hypothetical protein
VHSARAGRPHAHETRPHSAGLNCRRIRNSVGLLDVPQVIVKGIFDSKCGEANNPLCMNNRSAEEDGPHEWAMSGKQEQEIRVALSTMKRIEAGKPLGAISECSGSFFVICSKWVIYQGG